EFLNSEPSRGNIRRIISPWFLVGISRRHGRRRESGMERARIWPGYLTGRFSRFPRLPKEGPGVFRLLLRRTEGSLYSLIDGIFIIDNCAIYIPAFCFGVRILYFLLTQNFESGNILE